jgi:hypothetical protein
MTTAKNRGAIRVGRRVNGTRLLVKPAKSRKGLLLGSSFAGGALMVIGATMMLPNAAMAACSGTTTVTCSGSSQQFNDNAPGGSVTATVVAGSSWDTSANNNSSTSVGFLNIDASSNATYNVDLYLNGSNINSTTLSNTKTNSLGINLASGLDGTVSVQTIDSHVTLTSTNDALRIRTGASTNGDGTVVVTSNGTLRSSATGQGIDAKSGAGGVTININGGSITSENSEAIVAQAGGDGNPDGPGSWGSINITTATGTQIKGGNTSSSSQGVTGVAAYNGGAGGSGSYTAGIFAFITDTSSTGVINITTSGTVTSHGYGVIGYTAGSGKVTIDAKNTVTANNADGINALAAAGGAEVTVEDDVTSTSGDGVQAKATNGGAVKVTVGSSESDVSVIGGATGILAVSGGTTTIDNYGHVQGSSAGINASGGTVATITNYSLNSIIASGGAGSGVEASAYDQVVFDNRAALTAGLLGTGGYIHEISGDNVFDDGDVVDVWNYDGGILAGGINGLVVNNIGAPTEGDGASVYIDNAGDGWWRHKDAGGLIIGLTGAGVSVDGTEGDVTIDNSLTRRWATVDLTSDSIDPLVATDAGEGGLLEPLPGILSDPSAGGLGDEFAYGTGIWGGQTGINIDDVAGHFHLDNTRGIVVGMDDGSVGLDVNNVRDGVSIDNSSDGSWWWLKGKTDSYSLILGSGQGAYITDIIGDVDYYNNFGITYGHGGGGIRVDSVTEGDVYIANAAGLIEGYYGDAISVDHVQGGSVTIDNKYGEGDWLGGDIIGGTSAIVIGASESDGADVVTINNGKSWWDWNTHSVQGGLIASGGGESGTAPVIYIRTNDGEGDGTTINNHGVIASLGPDAFKSFPTDGTTAYFDSYLGAGAYDGIGIVGNLGDNPGDLQFVYDDADEIAQAVESGTVGLGLSSLPDYMRAAGALTVLSPDESGKVDINNYSDGIVFGRVDLTGSSQDSEGEYAVGNNFWNYGKWFTLGQNTVYGPAWNSIHNEGLIQTAFGSEGGDVTTFTTDEFFNDYINTDAYVSQTDGDANDHVNIDGTFFGSNGEGGHSFFSIDAYLAGVDNSNAAADYFYIDGAAFGSTGIIVNNIADSPSTVANPDGLLVVHTEDGLQSGYSHNDWGGYYDTMACTGFGAAYCKEGDGFFISDKTQNYETIDGYGTIRDGLYSWFLQQRQGTYNGEGDDFYLVSQLSPDGHDQPGVTDMVNTLALNTLGTPEENLQGNTYPLPGSGGAGADPSSSGGYRGALWGRVTGDWTRRDTTITDVVTYDTGSSQNSYALTAGVEMRPADENGLRVGIYGGYVNAAATFDTFSGKSSASGGTVGGYAAYNNGAWYADAELKADFLSVNYNSPSVNIDTHGTTIAGQINTGYRYQNGTAFFEPIASFAFANAMIADGTDGSVTVRYSNGQSLRAGLGARVGVTVGKPGATQTEFDVLGKVWDEFGGPYTVTVDDGVTPLVASENIAGISGEVVGRATVYSADRTASGFVSVGGKFSSNSTSVTAKAGLRKNF